MPLLLTMIGFIIGAIFIIIGIIGWKKSRRNKTISNNYDKSLVLTPHAWAIGLSGMTGYPKKPENATWLCFEVSVNAISKPIDTLDLIIDGKSIPANQWHGKIVTAFNAYFKVTEWQWKGENQIELIAHIEGKSHSSGRIPIDFNVEPSGRSHRI